MDLPIGEVVVVNGQRMRHVGGGRFEHVQEIMTKRFDPSEGEPLHKVWHATESHGI